MKYAPSTTNIDLTLFRILLTPSWLSGLVDISIGVLLTAVTIVATIYQTSSIRLDYLQYQAGHVASTYESVNNRLSENNFISNLPLLIFWSLVGLIVYLFAANIFTAIHNTAELRTELQFVHTDRKKILWTALVHLLIRVCVLIIWVIYILFFIHHIFPYCVASAIAASGHDGFLMNAEYALVGTIVMVAALHLHAILMRLLLLKPRSFSSILYVD
jgi:hypothetical protein